MGGPEVTFRSVTSALAWALGEGVSPDSRRAKGEMLKIAKQVGSVRLLLLLLWRQSAGEVWRGCGAISTACTHAWC
jgi:hypothetical protein